jgi:hypothetical protein
MSRFFLTLLAFLALTATQLAAQSAPLFSCAINKTSSPGQLIAHASMCGMGRNFGFHSPWLPSSSNSNAATVTLEIATPEGPHQYRAYWVETKAAQTLLSAVTEAEARDGATAAELTTKLDELSRALLGLHSDFQGEQRLVVGIDSDPTTGRSIITVETPHLRGQAFYPLYSLMVVGLHQNQDQVFVTLAKANITPQWFAITVSFCVAVFLLGFIAVGLSNKTWRLFSGFKGHLSLSSFQIALFTCAAFFLLFYIFVRTGTLGVLPNDVLLLMGIVAAGGTGAKVSEHFSQSIKSSTLVWLNKRNWVQRDADYKLAHLVQDKRGKFDIFRFQALIFSILVAFFLLFSVGQSGLEDVELPTSILGVLGLSQVTYIGGKTIPSNTLGDLDEAVKTFEAMPSGTPDEVAAKEKQMKKIELIFEDTFGKEPDDSADKAVV